MGGEQQRLLGANLASLGLLEKHPLLCVPGKQLGMAGPEWKAELLPPLL